MSYKSDKERMRRDASEHRKKVWNLIKRTFFVFAITLVLFCIAFVFGAIWDRESAKDTTPPQIIGQERVIGYVGDSPLYKQMVTVSDNEDDNCIIEVNNSGVDINKVGEYKVYFRAKDASGNVSEVFTLTYVVKAREFSRETLMALIGEKAEELGITKEMTKKQQVKKIYAFVNSKNAISFTNESNIPNIDRKNWEIDWIEEAVLTLDSQEGDCYSYYALSKAFFEYFGIKNEGIQRSAASKDEGTHFWNIVEIDEGWYYYDATSLAGKFDDGTNNACLITQSKLDSYVTSGGSTEFYLMDSKPSKISKTPLN